MTKLLADLEVALFQVGFHEKSLRGPLARLVEEYYKQIPIVREARRKQLDRSSKEERALPGAKPKKHAAKKLKAR